MENFAKLYELSSQKELDKNKYIEIIKNLKLPEITEKIETPEFISYDMNRRKELLERNDDYSKLFFWQEYVFCGFWQKLRDDGLGHVLEFNTYGNRFFAKISLRLFCEKEDDETKDEFLKRKESFIKNTKYSYIKKNNEYRILDTDDNKQMLLDYFSSYLTFFTYKFKVINNQIINIELFFYDINISYKENVNEEKWDLSSVEKIGVLAKKAYQALDSRKYVSENIINHLVYGNYYDICTILQIKNNYTKKYEELFLSNRDSNFGIRKRGNELGATYNCDLMKNIVKEAGSILETYLAKKYCIHASDIRFVNGRLSFDACFSYDLCLLDLEENDERNFYFDNIAESLEDYFLYNIPAKYVDNIVRVLKEDIGILCDSVTLKTQVSKLYIENMKLCIEDISSLRKLLSTSK